MRKFICKIELENGKIIKYYKHKKNQRVFLPNVTKNINTCILKVDYTYFMFMIHLNRPSKYSLAILHAFSKSNAKCINIFICYVQLLWLSKV